MLLLTILLTGVKASGQSAIYVCEKTGKWGAIGDDGNEPRASIKEVKEEALKRCKDNGGEDCRLFYTNDSKGSYSFIRGDIKGKFVFAVGFSQQSEKEALKNAMDNYLQKGGIVNTGLETSSWYCPKDPVQKKKTIKN